MNNYLHAATWMPLGALKLSVKVNWCYLLEGMLTLVFEMRAVPAWRRSMLLLLMRGQSWVLVCKTRSSSTKSEMLFVCDINKIKHALFWFNL